MRHMNSSHLVSGVQLWAKINEAARIGKPLLLGEFNKLPPTTQRNAFVELVLSTLDTAIALGKPIAGASLSFLVGKFRAMQGQ